MYRIACTCPFRLIYSNVLFTLSAKEVYKPEKEPTGFFPPAHIARQPTESDDEKSPIKPDCYVPNSVILRLLWPPQELDDEQKTKKEYRPPGMTEEQMKQIAALNEKVNFTLYTYNMIKNLI